MAKDIKIVQVAFNVLDADQQELYNHVRIKNNQSGFIKRLIQRDIDNGFLAQTNHHSVQINHQSVQLDSEADFSLNGFI
jgi:hypothetical protein